MNIQYSKVDDVAETLEFTPTQESDKDEGYLIVPPSAAVFAFGLLRTTGESLAVPTSVEIALFHDDEQIREEDNNATFVEHRLVSYAATNPPAGKWKVEVRSEGNDTFVLSAGVVRKSLDILRSFHFDRCKACKMSLKPIIFALLAKLTAGGVAALHAGNIAAALAHLPAAALTALHHATGLPIDWLRGALTRAADFMGVETPWAKLARFICEKLGLCPPRGAAE